MPDKRVNSEERKRYPASYAALSENSKGRVYPVPPNSYRTAYQRDRDRVIHATAFRRLQHKTQVFANMGSGDESDHYRSRLTHTIEVAQISRSIARSLGLNDDLSEAIALAHDLGHTPFGHSGEEVLAELLSDRGGFNHNHQSLRVVDYLEKRYPKHHGLNLTYETREAIIKHESKTGLKAPDEFDTGENALLEGQIVDLADEIAYNGHDIDDGLSAGILSLKQLRKLDFLNEIFVSIDSQLSDASDEMTRNALIRILVDRMINDLVSEIERRLSENKIETVADVRQSPNKLAGFSDKQDQFNKQLKKFLRQNMYLHPKLKEMKKQSAEIIGFLFEFYPNNMETIPSDFRDRYPDQDDLTLTVDYIAGMTDRFAAQEFRLLR